MRYFLTAVLFVFIISAGSSCKRCYNCTKKCGTCAKSGMPTLAGCDGDSQVSPYTVDTWKVYLESQGYTCSYNNVVENDICGNDNKSTYQGNNYTCVSK